ncbi:probable pyridoxal 5'-phosphate synthase subunit PDX2 isoform X2 [Magnolia sinica]|uniref:probable pyridoxal 5'-phosphate synthase subunit PDX2 isoform X2 n=1 Tax=Magnolia sinica TaxID=86752 RepID=UPI00265874B9|nr:probable pyridoxal 5'-phosphate synthase subunit PDX2 isoform X2 [Magnolia sinica]
MPSVGVLALQGSFNEHIAGELLFFFPFLLPKNRKREEDVSAPFLILYSLYHPVSALRRIGVKGVEVRKAEQLENVNGLIIPGGESTTMAKLAHYHNLKLGGQELVGGLDCTVHRNFFGSQLQSFETELLVPELAAKEGGPASFRGVFIRAPAILEAGPDVEVLAYYSVAVDKSTSPKSSFESQEEKTVSEEKVIVAVKQGNLLGTAFHPELTADTRWHSFFLKMVSEDGDPSWSSATTSEGDVSGYQQAIPNDLPIFQ